MCRWPLSVENLNATRRPRLSLVRDDTHRSRHARCDVVWAVDNAPRVLLPGACFFYEHILPRARFEGAVEFLRRWAGKRADDERWNGPQWFAGSRQARRRGFDDAFRDSSSVGQIVFLVSQENETDAVPRDEKAHFDFTGGIATRPFRALSRHATRHWFLRGGSLKSANTADRIRRLEERQRKNWLGAGEY